MNTRIIFYLLGLTVLFSLMVGCTNQEEANKKESERLKNDNSKTPPSLTISVGGNNFKTAMGTYSWSYSNSDGTLTFVNADSAAPPLLVKDHQAIDITSNTEVKLLFPKPPLDYQVRIWEVDGSIVASYKEVVLSGYTGRVIYEVTTTWEQGTVHYAFVLDIEE
ncbi:hypothetical protein IM538_04095 [Cytobacillus suaedae]|nr:hypothetical protein IM538_04095 [Cytobacillus suaedae]